MTPWSELRIGVKSPDAGNWQRFLRAQGYRDNAGEEIVVDEFFGLRTDFATKSWQRVHGLIETGVVSMVERGLAQSASSDGYVPFLQARNFTPVPTTTTQSSGETRPSGRVIDVVVIHDMEYPQVPEGAEWCAAFFAGPGAPRASAHYCVDDDAIIQCVRDRDVAWHAPGANHNGIGIEHAGYAKQSRADWLDTYSRAELAISAKLTARLCVEYSIPIVKLAAADLQAGKRGICGHKDVTYAFSNGKGHWDPGEGFPWDDYLALVTTVRADMSDMPVTEPDPAVGT